MIRKIFVCLSLLMVFSCQEKEEKLEIQPELLVEVLADVHIIEGALLSVRPAQKDSMRAIYYNQVFEIHEVEEEAFKHDMTILKRNPRMMERVYEKVLEDLNEKDAEMKKEKKPDKK